MEVPEIAGAEPHDSRAVAGDQTIPEPAGRSEPAPLHGLERAIERAELRRSVSASELRLWVRPEHLGRVALRVVERTGAVEVVVRAESASTRSHLAEALPTLVENLRTQGLEVAETRRGSEAAIDWWPHEPPDRRQEGRERKQKEQRGRTEAFPLQAGGLL